MASQIGMRLAFSSVVPQIRQGAGNNTAASASNAVRNITMYVSRREGHRERYSSRNGKDRWPIPPSDLGQLRSLRPAHLFQLAMGLPGQLLVNRHQVMRLLLDSGNFFSRNSSNDFSLHPPILVGPHFAQIATQFHKARISFLLRMAFPLQNLIDFLQPRTKPDDDSVSVPSVAARYSSNWSSQSESLAPGRRISFESSSC